MADEELLPSTAICHLPAAYYSLRGVGEVRLVLGVGGAVVQLDVDVARGEDVLFEREPDRVEVFGLREGAEAVEALALLVVDVDPSARGVRVLPAGGQARRR